MTARRTPVAAFAMRPDLPEQLFTPDDLAALTRVADLDPSVTFTGSSTGSRSS